MSPPWDSSSWIPDQNPNLRGKRPLVMFPGRHPSASNPLLLDIRQEWGWNLHWGEAVMQVLCQHHPTHPLQMGQEGKEGGDFVF